MPELVELPAQTIVGLREEVTGQSIGEFFGRAVGTAMARVPAELVAGPLTQVVHRDDGDRFDVTLGLPVSALPDVEGLAVAEVPAGAALREVHVGDYPGLRDAYARLESALRERGLTRQTSVERYVVGPADNPDPSAWRTEVDVPLP